MTANADTDVQGLFNRIRFTGDPVAHPGSVVRSGDARFTVLTPRLLRLEWSATGRFEDRGTYSFPTRRAEPPHFEVRIEGDTLVVDTGALEVRYLIGSGRFGPSNLSVSLDVSGDSVRWVPGTPDPKNLRGTRRTVDGCAGDAALEPGIVSRAGWALHDDSRSVVFEAEDGWVSPGPEYDLQDWYFFGYGHDYKGALAEYLRFGGRVPLIPRYVLGLWWSRYWAYSDQELRELVGEFEEQGIPLDVLVVDMDWHLPDTWTGYSWNRALFPDPPEFLGWVHSKGLRAAFNLHPAQGIQRHEVMYDEFAEAVGADTREGDAVPFRITDKLFVEHYFRLLHHPMEEDGVDFWWVDWQQGEVSEMRGLDPLPWLNHLHFNDSVRRGTRAMLYSRWGGLGNHRYHIGFSGDTYVVWPALQFQPYLTASASNVAYGWWSHDVGGHMGGATDPELYARWVQFGALSPCLRLHSTKDSRAERRPWAYPDEVCDAAKQAISLRYRLLPYIYTMARVASDTGISLCRPMYFEYPDHDGAYAARYQYFFGDHVIAAPMVFPMDGNTGLAATDVWVPPGTWIEFTTKEMFEGPRWVRILGDLQRIPMLVRAGAILPLSAGFSDLPAPRLASGSSDAIRKDALVMAAYPGPDGSFRLYEDDGATEGYRSGQFAWTDIRSAMRDSTTWEVQVGPVDGHCDALPEERSLELRLVGVCRPDWVTVDGERTIDWRHDDDQMTAIIPVAAREKDRSLTVTAFAEGGLSALGEGLNRRAIASDVRRVLGDQCPENPWDVDAVLESSAPGRLDAVARLGGPFVRFIDFVTPEEALQTLGRVIVGAPAENCVPYAIRATFSRRGAGVDEEVVVQHAKVNGSLVLDVPFSFEGAAQSLWWEAAVEVEWRGRVLSFDHRSRPLFPTVHAWRCAVCREGENAPDAAVRDVETTVVDNDEGHPYRFFIQHTDHLTKSLDEPFVVNLVNVYGEALSEEGTLSACLATTVVVPEARDAVIRFTSAGETEIVLNGESVEEASLDTPATDPPPFFQQTRTTETVRLQPGRNRIEVWVRPSVGWRGLAWRFGAAFADLNGDPMGDLVYDPEPAADS